MQNDLSIFLLLTNFYFLSCHFHISASRHFLCSLFIFVEIFQSDSRRNKVINYINFFNFLSLFCCCFYFEGYDEITTYLFFFLSSFFCVVLNLCSGDTTESELCRVFSAYGNVKSTKIIVDRAGVSKGYGFVTFETELEASRLHDVNVFINNH